MFKPKKKTVLEQRKRIVATSNGAIEYCLCRGLLMLLTTVTMQKTPGLGCLAVFALDVWAFPRRSASKLAKAVQSLSAACHDFVYVSVTVTSIFKVSIQILFGHSWRTSL